MGTIMHLLSILFGKTKPITRKHYLTAGFSLMILKYCVDAGTIYALRDLSPAMVLHFADCIVGI